MTTLSHHRWPGMERQEKFSRREILRAGLGATIWCLPGVGRARDDHCDVFETLLGRIKKERNDLPNWAVSVAPGAVETTRKKVAALRRDFNRAQSAVDQARINQLIAYANAAGTSMFVIAGLAGAAVPIVLTGSIVYGGGLIVVRTLAAPQSVDSVTITPAVAVGRVGAVLESVGESVEVVSGSTARFSRIGGILVSTASLTFDWIAAVRSSESVQRAQEKRRKLKDQLAAADDALAMMRGKTVAERMRGGCLDAIEKDVQLLQNNACVNVNLP